MQAGLGLWLVALRVTLGRESHGSTESPGLEVTSKGYVVGIVKSEEEEEGDGNIRQRSRNRLK